MDDRNTNHQNPEISSNPGDSIQENTERKIAGSAARDFTAADAGESAEQTDRSAAGAEQAAAEAGESAESGVWAAETGKPVAGAEQSTAETGGSAENGEWTPKTEKSAVGTGRSASGAEESAAGTGRSASEPGESAASGREISAESVQEIEEIRRAQRMQRAAQMRRLRNASRSAAESAAQEEKTASRHAGNILRFGRKASAGRPHGTAQHRTNPHQANPHSPHSADRQRADRPGTNQRRTTSGRTTSGRQTARLSAESGSSRNRQPGSGSIRAKSAAVWEKLKQNAGVLIAVVFVVILAIAIPKAFSRSDGAADVSAKTSAADPAAAETQSGENLAAADQASGENEDGSAADSLEGQEDTGETGSAGEALASLTSAFSNDGLAAAETEEQTYSTDASGNLVVPEREAGSFETEPEWTNTLVSTGDETLDEANRLAAGYDYDSAISLLQSAEDYTDNADYQSAVAEYESEKAQCTPYSAMNTITHIFFHSLVVDTSRAFDETIAISKQDGTNKVKAYNEVMTTVDEFCRIISDMYEKGYVLVGLHDIAGMTQNADGTETMQFREILLPPGKTPFVLSVDDVSYYEYMTGHGFASRLVLDENGKVTNEYINPDGSVMYGSYDVLTILEDFIEAHPDFSYRGARGTLALTGYEGILGYRTSDFWYNWNCDYFDEKFASQRESMYYNNENIEQDKATAKQVADAIKELGWTFASHSWGHRDMGAISYEEMVWDADMWEKEVQPLVGETDLMIFPNGADIDSWRGYAEDNQKFQYLKQLGFDYFCNVDSSQYWIQIGERGDYFRMGRRNLDGTRMWEAIESFVSPGSATNRLSDLFDVRTVFDWSRPTPVE